ncbi:MAG: hypothetical protein C0482_16210 [Gordonia sp.]|nr:hypothetical protein [Gordonia sp. (in: high G+C Gram-positive bacteria)]
MREGDTLSIAISFDPEAAANALLAEQSERERVVRDLAASYGDILQREHELDAARTTHLRLRARASEFGITDAALKKAGIPTVATTPRRTGATRRGPRRSVSPATSATQHENSAPIENASNHNGV